VILQASANPGEVAGFLYENGRLSGPQGFSTQGMRIQNENSGSTSLFAHPMAIEPIPEEQGRRTKDEGLGSGVEPLMKPARGLLEAHMEAVLAALATPAATNPTLRQGHMALLKRWYYRPEARRAGEIFFPDAEGRWPIKALLRGAGRIAASGFKAPVSSS